jgi:hypothetical protein
MCALHHYGPDTIWTDEIGATTKILWDKQDSRDLNEINHRSQGVAEKIPETQ